MQRLKVVEDRRLPAGQPQATDVNARTPVDEASAARNGAAGRVAEAPLPTRYNRRLKIRFWLLAMLGGAALWGLLAAFLVG